MEGLFAVLDRLLGFFEGPIPCAKSSSNCFSLYNANLLRHLLFASASSALLPWTLRPTLVRVPSVLLLLLLHILLLLS